MFYANFEEVRLQAIVLLRAARQQKDDAGGPAPIFQTQQHNKAKVQFQSHRFREFQPGDIMRRNQVSGYLNQFAKIVALFICRSLNCSFVSGLQKGIGSCTYAHQLLWQQQSPFWALLPPSLRHRDTQKEKHHFGESSTTLRKACKGQGLPFC